MNVERLYQPYSGKGEHTMMKRRIYAVVLIGAVLFLSVPMPALAEHWHHHRPPVYQPRSSFHFGIFLGIPVVTPYYPHGHYRHVHDSRCPVVVEQRVPVYIHPAPTWYIRR